MKLTLSIDGAVLKVLSYEGKQVLSWISLPFNPALLERGFIADEEAIAKVIKNALTSRGLKAENVIAALPGLGSLSRIITLPPGKDIDLKIVIPGEVRRLCSVSLDENYLFWQALPQLKSSFFTLVVPKSPLDSLVRTLKLAGLRPISIDLASLALARAVNQSQAIIARVEANSFDFIIIVNDIPMVMRSFLGEEEFESSAAVSLVAEEVERTVSFYNNSHLGPPLPSDVPVYPCGSFASASDFAPAVEKATGHPLGQPDPVLQFPEGFPVAQMMVNIGLALKVL